MVFRRCPSFFAQLFAVLAWLGAAALVAAAPPIGRYNLGTAFLHVEVAGYPTVGRLAVPVAYATVYANGTFEVKASGMTITTITKGKMTQGFTPVRGTVSATGALKVKKPAGITGRGQITGTTMTLRCRYPRNDHVENVYTLTLHFNG